jgi:hypothetical protein
VYLCSLVFAFAAVQAISKWCARTLKSANTLIPPSLADDENIHNPYKLCGRGKGHPLNPHSAEHWLYQLYQSVPSSYTWALSRAWVLYPDIHKSAGERANAFTACLKELEGEFRKSVFTRGY